MINSDRMATLFMDLVRIDSVSKEEAAIAAVLTDLLSEMGAAVEQDQAHQIIGGNAGNLIARFPGTVDAPPILLNAHMDTVEPGRGVRPRLTDGVFRSDGTTILGADDKSAIAILLEVMRVLQEGDRPRCPIELVLTVCEEIGLKGARHLDCSRIQSRFGYALDTTATNLLVTQAPTLNRLDIRVYGKDAHAGVAPETGINAIWLAAKAVARLPLGRINELTTCNIGTISGGKAANIVPNLAVLSGEVRSHDPEELQSVTRRIIDTFESVAASHRTHGADGVPRVEIDVDEEFRQTDIPETHPVVTTALAAARNLGRELKCSRTGGGADANIFSGNGIPTGVLGTGMTDMHSVRESISLADMVRTAELVLEIIDCHTQGHLDKSGGGK